MKHLATSPQNPDGNTATGGFAALWQQLKSKNISYLTLPLLVMATVVEFVILATGWKYQQAVCLPQGMGVTFFGIGPIGATILAVELLKLPLAIWTASRTGWQKTFMLFCGLPLICVLTFQLVKDMAVYEMGAAMTPASQLLEKASAEETKMSQLKGELAAIEVKKVERENKLAEFAAKKAKAKTELEEALKRNDESRQDAISLTEYQKKELSEVEARQAAITRQFDVDAAQLSKAIADLRARRETELGRAGKWNAEEARIENEYKAKLADYTNRKNAYEKDKAEYDNANVLKRQLMREPVDPGVAPVRESNTILKSAEIAELDSQIKAKEAELIAISNRRRDSVAQVAADARRVREDFDKRSTAKRDETDKNRAALLAASAALADQLAAEEKQLDLDLAAAVQKVDGIRSQVDVAQKKAESLYEAREAAIKNTQVHRIATTVEIVRGLLFGERPMSVNASAKQRGDILTDQISMVRIWVYPVLAFIVAFLPTLMVEIGFSTLFKTENQRPPHRLGFFGRRLHWLYKRAGQQKILRAERLVREVSAEIAARDQVIAATKSSAEQALAAKDVELQAGRDAFAAAAVAHEEQIKAKENEWVAKFGSLAESLNRTVAEKQALQDFQKAEIERQVQLRQNGWSDRITQLNQELDAVRATAETERATLLEEHQKRFKEVTEDCKAQVTQARRQAADAEFLATEKSAKLAYDLKEALNERDAAVLQLKQQTEALSQKLSQTTENAARELEKTARAEKHRAEQQQLEFSKTLRQREEKFEHQLAQREQELSLQYEARIAEEQGKAEQKARRREAELQRQFETSLRETDARWKQELQQREDAMQTMVKQQVQQKQAQAEVHASEVQTLAEQQLRRRELELERQLDAQSREAEARLKQEIHQKEIDLQSKLKQREQEFAVRTATIEAELKAQWESDLRMRQEEWERQVASRVRTTEARLNHEMQQKEEQFQAKLRQRDQQWQAQLDSARTESQAQAEQFRRHEADAEARLREMESNFRHELQQKVETTNAESRQREQALIAQLTAQTESRLALAQEEWEKAGEKKIRAAVVPFKAQIARTEKERDEARQVAQAAAGRVHELEKKLTEVSSFLSAWKDEKKGGSGSVDRDVLDVSRDGLNVTTGV